jgi:hypothetical protein
MAEALSSDREGDERRRPIAKASIRRSEVSKYLQQMGGSGEGRWRREREGGREQRRERERGGERRRTESSLSVVAETRSIQSSRSASCPSKEQSGLCLPQDRDLRQQVLLRQSLLRQPLLSQVGRASR